MKVSNKKKIILTCIAILITFLLQTTNAYANQGDNESYTVSFYTKEGVLLEEQTVNSNILVQEPKREPTKEGYTFMGWYENTEYIRKFDFSKPVTSDKSIYALFEPNENFIHNLNITFEKPKAGDKVEYETTEDGEYTGYGVKKIYESVTTDNEHVNKMGTFIKGYPDSSEDWDEEFIGEFEGGKEYGIVLGFYTSLGVNSAEGYYFAKDLNVTINNTTSYQIEGIGESNGCIYFTIYASFKVDEEEKEPEVISNLNITFNKPAVGDEVARITKTGEVQGHEYEYETQSLEPNITVDNENVHAYAFFSNGYPEGEEGVGMFYGKFEEGKDYYMAFVLGTYSDDYVFDKDLRININNVTNYKLEDFTPYGNLGYVYATFQVENKPENSTEEDSKKKEYTLESDEGEISFTKEDGHTYSFLMLDYSALSNEELENWGMEADEVSKLVNNVKKVVDEKGSVLAIYDFIVAENGNAIHEGPFEVKIRLTDEMKKYNSFKLYYIDEDFNAKEAPIDMKVEGDYLVGNLNHLSLYTLIGNVVEDTAKVETATSNTTNNTTNNTKKEENITSSNPKTGDNILIFVGLAIVSIAVIAGTVIYQKKNN